MAAQLRLMSCGLGAGYLEIPHPPRVRGAGCARFTCSESLSPSAVKVMHCGAAVISICSSTTFGSWYTHACSCSELQHPHMLIFLLCSRRLHPSSSFCPGSRLMENGTGTKGQLARLPDHHHAAATSMSPTIYCSHHRRRAFFTELSPRAPVHRFCAGTVVVPD